MGGESDMGVPEVRPEAGAEGGAGVGSGGDGEIAAGSDSGAAVEAHVDGRDDKRDDVRDDVRDDERDDEGAGGREGEGHRDERATETAAPDPVDLAEPAEAVQTVESVQTAETAEPLEPAKPVEPTEIPEPVTDQVLTATPEPPPAPSTLSPASPPVSPAPPATWASPPWAVPQPPGIPAKPRMPRRDKVAATAALGVGIALAAANIVAASGSPAKPKPPTAAQLQDETARAAWRTMPVDSLFPPTLDRPGGEQYIRLGVADPAGCDVLPAAFVAALAKDAPGTTCDRVLRATYADSTQTVVATVGVVVVGGTAAQRDQVWRGWTPDSDSRDADLMPSTFAVPDSVAAQFTDAQRISWNSQTSSDGSFLVYAVSGFLDGRAGSKPADLRSGVTKVLAGDSPPVQAAVDLPPQIVDLLARAGKKA